MVVRLVASVGYEQEEGGMPAQVSPKSKGPGSQKGVLHECSFMNITVFFFTERRVYSL